MLLVLVLGVGASFAADSNQTHIQASDDTDTVVSIGETDTVSSNDDEVYSAGNDSDALSATAGSFTELSTLINSSTTGSITLDKDYTYNSATDSAFVGGIIINRTISIDGAGKTINGNNAARIFNVYGSNVLIRDVNFVNGNSTTETGAIYWEGANGYLVSSIFKNNVAKSYYGAVYWKGTYGKISNCIFEENYAGSSSGAAAISVSAKGTILSSCTFKKNHASDYGALNFNAPNGVVDNCIFEENSATKTTAALYWGTSAAQGFLKNCKFYKNCANNLACVQWARNYGTIDNCTFEYNYANVSAGALYITQPFCRVYNCIFKNNTVSNNGGALYLASEGANAENCIFEYNHGGNGGAFFSGTNFGYLRNCTFNYNTATNGGGAYIQQQNVPIITDCTFRHNTATNNGGAVVASVAIKNSIFEENSATSGGAIHTILETYVFTNNQFIKNSATDGGAIYASNNKGFLSDLIFELNSANNNGGAIYCSANYVTIINSEFNGNKANNYGGGVYNTGNEISVLKSTFKSNTAASNSGAIYVQSGKSVSLDCTYKTSTDTVNANDITNMPNELYVSNNGVSTATGSRNNPIDWLTAFSKISNGGTIYLLPGVYNNLGRIDISQKTVNIMGLGDVTINLNQRTDSLIYFRGPASLLSNIKFINAKPSVNTIDGYYAHWSVISNCTFDNGGQIRIYGRYVTIRDSCFKNNKGTNGAAITGDMYHVTYVYNCTFINNTATNGAAIYRTTLIQHIIENSTFINNHATNNGGAIYFASFLNTINNCTFINNTAGSNGGAIFTSGQEISINNCTFSQNDAPNGGATYVSGYKSSIADSDFNNNNASNGGAVYSTGKEVSVSGSNFTGNGASDQGGAVYSTGTGASVSGSSFEQNSATNGSAVMVGEKTDITIEGSDFNSNSGKGSVYVPEGSNFVIDSETTFENNIGGDLETPGVVSAKVLYVNITATGDGLLQTGPTNWERGFANVQDGGILYVLPGTYDLSQLSPIIVDKSLSIIGVSEGVIFTNGARGTIFDIKADNVKLSNIKFNGISGDYIKWDGINGEIESSTFDGQGTNSNNKLISTTVGSTNFKVTNTNFTNLKYNNIIYATNYLTTVENAIFKSNTQYNTNSILIDAVGSDFSILNSKFESNNAKLVKFESAANRGAISGTTFTSNAVGSGNSMIYINSKSSTISGSTFKSSNTGGTYKNIYGTEDFTLSGNTFEGVGIGLNSVSTVIYPNNPTISGTFNYGVNKAYNIPVTANNELLPNVARSNDATTFTYSWDTPLPDTYTLKFANTDANGNKYIYTSTTPSVTATVNRLSTVYISPEGTGTGASASDPTNWDNVANLLTDTGSVVFTAGNYKLNGKTISKSWKLSNSGNVIIDAENKGRIFTINANNVEITGITFKNGKVSGNQGSAISWTGTGGKITNSIFNENTGVPISSTNDLTITNTQMKNQISLTKSNINWGTTETVKGTFSHSAPSTVTVLFNGASQGSFSVSSKIATASIGFVNPSTQAVGSYVVTDQKNISKEVL